MALLIWIGMQEGNQWAKELVIRDEGNKVWQYKWKFNDITRHVCLLPFASPRLPRRASYRNGRALKTRKWCEKTPDRRRFIQTGEYTATGQEAKPWEYAEGLQKQLLSSIIVVSLLLWCISRVNVLCLLGSDSTQILRENGYGHKYSNHWYNPLNKRISMI